MRDNGVVIGIFVGVGLLFSCLLPYPARAGAMFFLDSNEGRTASVKFRVKPEDECFVLSKVFVVTQRPAQVHITVRAGIFPAFLHLTTVEATAGGGVVRGDLDLTKTEVSRPVHSVSIWAFTLPPGETNEVRIRAVGKITDTVCKDPNFD